MLVHTGQWDDIKKRLGKDSAQAEFDASIKEFFAPLTKAAGKLKAAKANKIDPLAAVVVTEEVKATAGVAEELIELNRCSMLLRAIEEGHEDRLLWIDEKDLAITAFDGPGQAEAEDDATAVAVGIEAAAEFGGVGFRK